jgi:glutathione S-transferase
MVWNFYGWLGKILQAFELPGRARAKKPFPGHTLYHFYVSPPCIRVRRKIYRLGLGIPFKEVLVDEAAWKDLVKQGGKDQVPCLKIEDMGTTRWMYESSEIIEYLDARAIGQTGTLNLNATMD